MRARIVYSLMAAWLIAGSAAAQNTQPTPAKYALLIGIDKYSHPAADIQGLGAGVPAAGRYAPGMIYYDLAGPLNDVDAMRQILTTKFHFTNDAAHMDVLLDEAATHDAIMQALQKFLVDIPQKGDIVVLYVSSHGSLRIYPKDQGEGQLYNLLDDPKDQRHVENTLVPYDWYTGADDIFSRDLRHFYRAAVAKGVHVTAIFDSCHSGDLGRGLLSGKLVPRDFEFDQREMTPNPYVKEERPTLPQDDPNTPVLILSATQKDQLAIDDQTRDPAHGAFTTALVDALNALPEDRPASDVFSRLQVSMELAPNSIHQQPELDTSPDRRRQTLFGGAVANGPTSVAVVSVTNEGVLLDIGIVADIGPGSIFTTMPAGNEAPVELKVMSSEGLGRSLAHIQTPDGVVKAKDLVQLKAAVPWQRPDLFLYTGTANPGLADIQDALAAVNAAHLTLVADPSKEEDPWNYHLYWESSHWTLYNHNKTATGARGKTEAPMNLGAKLTAKALGRVSSGSVVWFDPPLAHEIVQALLPPPTANSPHLAAQLTTDRTKAMYVLGSKLSGQTISYAWFKRSDIDSDVQTPKEIGAGCSPGSSYPLRTEWVDQTSTDATSAALNKYAVKLAKLNGWFLLQSSALSKRQQFPYTLALRPVSGGPDIGQNGKTPVGEYDLYLTGTPTSKTTPQWVYVLNIDCEGNGSVVWPYEAPPDKISQPAAKFPADDVDILSPIIKLPGYPFPVGPPLGTDTYLLLTTSTRLNNYHALEFDSVVSRSVTDNPLEELLDDTSDGMRLAGDPIPTDWGVWAMQVQSLPSPAQPKQ
jgi:hypothetical protein